MNICENVTQRRLYPIKHLWWSFFQNNTKGLKAVNYFCKSLHHKYLIRCQLNLWNIRNSCSQVLYRETVLKAVNYFCKSLHHKYLIRCQLNLWNIRNSCSQVLYRETVLKAVVMESFRKIWNFSWKRYLVKLLSYGFY